MRPASSYRPAAFSWPARRDERDDVLVERLRRDDHPRRRKKPRRAPPVRRRGHAGGTDPHRQLCVRSGDGDAADPDPRHRRQPDGRRPVRDGGARLPAGTNAARRAIPRRDQGAQQTHSLRLPGPRRGDRRHRPRRPPSGAGELLPEDRGERDLHLDGRGGGPSARCAAARAARSCAGRPDVARRHDRAPADARRMGRHPVLWQRPDPLGHRFRRHLV